MSQCKENWAQKEEKRISRMMMIMMMMGSSKSITECQIQRIQYRLAGEQSSLRVPCTRKKEGEERLSNLSEYVEWKLKKKKA